jgi:hypothetical protein
MRIGFLALALPALLLVACDEPPQEPDPLEPAPLPDGSAGAAMGPGLYSVGDETTIYGRTRLAADGTFTDLDEAGETVHRGTWRADGDTICLDLEGDAEDQQEHCWRNDPPAEDGSFMSRRLDGEKAYQVTPLAEAE